MMDKFKKQQIRNLLFIMSSALFVSFAFSALLLYKYNPSGQYDIKNILISPDIVFLLNYNDKNSKTGGQSRFIFDKMEFDYNNKETHVKEKKNISADQYTLFYQMTATKKSVLPLTDDIRNLFNKGQVAMLKIWVKTDSKSSSQGVKKLFQEIDFAEEGGYFRVGLREADVKMEDPYAYFYAPGIYPQVLALFSSQ